MFSLSSLLASFPGVKGFEFYGFPLFNADKYINLMYPFVPKDRVQAFLVISATSISLTAIVWFLARDRGPTHIYTPQPGSNEVNTVSPKVPTPQPRRPSSGRSKSQSSKPAGRGGVFRSFKPGLYRISLRELSDAALINQEISNMTTEAGGEAGIAGGAVGAILTLGMTAPTLALSGRQLYLAGERLKLIREEMSRRGLPPSKMTTGMMVEAVGPRALLGLLGIGY